MITAVAETVIVETTMKKEDKRTNKISMDEVAWMRSRSWKGWPFKLSTCLMLQL